MIRCLAFAIAILLSACDTGEVKPTEAEMDRIETELAKQECIGELSRWERQYLYQPEYVDEEVDEAMEKGRMPRPSSYDRNVIIVYLREAGFEDFGNGRKSHSNFPEGMLDNDDREYLIAFGSYDARNEALDLVACGPNM